MENLLLTTDFARLLQNFFCKRLIQQKNASQQTIYSYRDAFRLLLRFGEQQLGKSAADLHLEDINAYLGSGIPRSPGITTTKLYS